MLHKIPQLFMFVVIGFLVISCQKDELTRPAEVQVKFKMGRQVQENEHFSFSEGSFQIKSIYLTGDREKGEDISFTSDFGTLIEADLSSGTAMPPIHFDLPQGSYNNIELVVTTGSAIAISGLYKRAAPLLPDTPVTLELDIEEFKLQVENEDRLSDISLDKTTGAVIEVYLNPIDWFETVPLVNLEGATLETVNGLPSMVISKDSNQRLYENLNVRIPEALMAIIK